VEPGYQKSWTYSASVSLSASVSSDFMALYKSCSIIIIIIITNLTAPGHVNILYIILLYDLLYSRSTTNPSSVVWVRPITSSFVAQSVRATVAATVAATRAPCLRVNWGRTLYVAAADSSAHIIINLTYRQHQQSAPAVSWYTQAYTCTDAPIVTDANDACTFYSLQTSSNDIGPWRLGLELETIGRVAWCFFCNGYG